MPLPSKNNFLEHARWLRKGAKAASVDAMIELDSMRALLRAGPAHMNLHPQFMVTHEGARQYREAIPDEGGMFAGWLPYRIKRWPIATDKLAFKRYAQSLGLQVPAASHEDEPPFEQWVIKRPVSSFGEQVKGPFRKYADSPRLDMAAGEYCEQFIEGKLLKVWFWNDQPVCCELDHMPFVSGDGVMTARELVLRRTRQNNKPSDAETAVLLARAETMLRFQGQALDAVIAKGKRMRIEFRYGSRLMRGVDRRQIDFSQPPSDDAWIAALPDIGIKLANAIPANLRQGTLFTVDAVLDSADKIWLLEMNCNPTVHPLAYPPMLAWMAETAQRLAVASSENLPAESALSTH